MSLKLKGDLAVARTITAARRVDSGAESQDLSATLTLVRHSEQWHNLTAAGGPQDVVLPDATTLPLGWDVVINNVDASNALAVKDGDTVPVLVKSVVAGRAYKFTLIDNGTAAGAWFKDYLEEADLIPTARYSATFNATTDWTAGGSYYTRTITESTHGRGTTPSIEVEENIAGTFHRVMLDDIAIAANGDITLQVTQSPVDARFAGRVVIV
jgi:hypothetical protein